MKASKHDEIVTMAAFSMINNNMTESKGLLIQSDSGELESICRNPLLLHSSLFRDILDTVNNVDDIDVIIVPDLNINDIKVVKEVLSMSWNSKKEILVKRSVLDVLKVLKVNIPKVQNVETVNEFIIFCPNQPCIYQSQGPENSRKNNLIQHLLKSHNPLLHRVAVERCFPPHSRSKGFLCRECHKSFRGKGPEIREAHVRSIHKHLFDMESVNKVVSEALKRMREVKKDLVSKAMTISVNLNSFRVPKQQRPTKKTKKTKKDHSIIRKKSKKQEITKIEKADFNGNTHSSITLEELLNSNVLSSEDIDNLNDSDDDLFESSVNAEFNASNKTFHKTIVNNDDLLKYPSEKEMVNDSDDDILEASVNVETNVLYESVPLKRVLSKDSKKVKRKNKKIKKIFYFSTLDDSDDFL